VGCFEYSPVEGAAANELPDPVPEEVKRQRFERFMETQSAISERRLAARVGRTEIVLIDSVDEEVAIARTSSDAPEIDGLVRISVDDYDIEPGDFIEVEIIAADAHDLEARIVA